MSSPAVEVDRLGKAYRIYASPARRILEGLSFGRLRGHHEFWALRDCSFELTPGSSIGLCGANGAGKSTLLKVLAGTTVPTNGRYRMHGRVASLLELGAGFHLEFTGRDNIVMNGVMMGFSKREIMAKMDEIIEFAELGAYIDEPVRTYSSGMGLRLGFAVAVSVEPDVLIIDEVFAVGDMYFQKKCIDKIYAFKKRNKTILFCSHSVYDIRQLCDQAIWLDHGKTMALGDSVEVTNEYATFQKMHITDGETPADQVAPDLSQERRAELQEMPRILDVRVFLPGTDEEVYEFKTGESVELRVWWTNPDPEAMPIQVGLLFVRHDTTVCGGVGTHFDGVRVEGGSGCTVLHLPEIQLLSGQFVVLTYLLDGEGVHRYQEYPMHRDLIMRAGTREVGLVRMPHRWGTSDRPPPARPEPRAEAPRHEGDGSQP